MESVSLTVIAGIIAAVIGSALLYFVTVVWRKILLPWIEDKKYRGIRIDGTWSLKDDGSEGGSQYTQRETLNLDQKATSLSGRLILVSKTAGAQSDRTLDVTGVVQDRFVIITCLPSNRRDLGYMVFLGEVSGDGTQIKGQASYRSTLTDQIDSTSAVYVRQPN